MTIAGVEEEMSGEEQDQGQGVGRGQDRERGVGRGQDHGQPREAIERFARELRRGRGRGQEIIRPAGIITGEPMTGHGTVREGRQGPDRDPGQGQGPAALREVCLLVKLVISKLETRRIVLTV